MVHRRPVAVLVTMEPDNKFVREKLGQMRDALTEVKATTKGRIEIPRVGAVVNVFDGFVEGIYGRQNVPQVTIV